MVVKIDAAGKDETVRIERSNARRNVDDRPDTGDLSSGHDDCADRDHGRRIHKDTTMDDPRAKENSSVSRISRGGWAYEQEVPGKINAAYQPVYDADGRYFRCLDRPHNLVLIVKRPGWPTLQS